MEIAHRRPEKDPTDRAQNGIADPAVQPGHGSGQDAALEAIPHHEILAGSQLAHEVVQAREIVTVIRVAHDDVCALRRFDPATQGTPIPLALYLYDPRSEIARNPLRAVFAPIVGDDDLALDARLREKGADLVDADGEGFGLVETRQYDGEFDGAADKQGRFNEARIHRKLCPTRDGDVQ